MDQQGSSAMIDAVGGIEGLRPIIEDFVGRMVNDPMIGFFFDAVDPIRLAERELQLSAALLGADVRYEGRPVRVAHAPHRIFGGQFMRRRKLLEEAFERHGAPRAVADALLAHVDRLRPQVTGEQGSDCRGDGMPTGPLLVSVPGRKNADGGA